jgi:hypothetical protein
MYYVKCCHCTVGIVETTATVKKIMGQVWTENTPKNKLNGTAICDACVKSRNENAGEPNPPYNKKGRYGTMSTVSE